MLPLPDLSELVAALATAGVGCLALLIRGRAQNKRDEAQAELDEAQHEKVISEAAKDVVELARSEVDRLAEVVDDERAKRLAAESAAAREREERLAALAAEARTSAELAAERLARAEERIDFEAQIRALRADVDALQRENHELTEQLASFRAQFGEGDRRGTRDRRRRASSPPPTA